MYEHLIAAWGEQRPAFEALQRDVQRRLGPLRDDPAANVHTLSSRLKSDASLRGKLARPDRTYRDLHDITDLLGFRVVTYFDDGVAQAARFVEGEFDVDLRHSVDKRVHDTHDRFGYRSLHYVCRAPSAFGELRFEVQLRTILQHAWAEIEHDLGYKTAAVIPPALRRRFSRLAGLLELADDEFVAIKGQFEAHVEDVAAKVRDGSEGIGLDAPALLASLDDPRVVALDGAVASHLRIASSDEPFYPDYLLRMLELVGIDSVDRLRFALEREMAPIGPLVDAYFAFASETFGLDPRAAGPAKRGYGLLFLAHRLLARSATLEVELVNRASDFFGTLDYAHAPEEARRVAVAFVRVARSDAGAALRS